METIKHLEIENLNREMDTLRNSESDLRRRIVNMILETVRACGRLQTDDLDHVGLDFYDPEFRKEGFLIAIYMEYYGKLGKDDYAVFAEIRDLEDNVCKVHISEVINPENILHFIGLLQSTGRLQDNRQPIS